jgi:hypothetical protein
MLGLEVDGQRQETRNTLQRFDKIRRGIEAFLRRKKVAGWVVEVLVGHATFYGLIRREVLSVFHTTYSFIQKEYFKPAVLWTSVREEFLAFVGLMVLVVAPWDMEWSPAVYATDASLTGYGVARAEWLTSEVAEVGRVSERRRWKLGAEKARSHALTAAGFMLGEDGNVLKGEDGCPLEVPQDVREDLGALRWTAEADFPEVPGPLLEGRRWETIMAKK